jgi:hypothetical protein
MTKKRFEFIAKMSQIVNRAIKKAVEENRRLGLPNVFVKNGRIYFELPNGTITTTNPLNS